MAEFTAAELEKWARERQKPPTIDDLLLPVACPWCEMLFSAFIPHQCEGKQAALREYERRNRQQLHEGSA